MARSETLPDWHDDLQGNRSMNPSDWVVANSRYLKPGGTVLDLACGSGRHSRHLLSAGYKVTAVDINVSGVEDLTANPNCQVIQADLEQHPINWPFNSFDGIVVTNYLHRPLFDYIKGSLAPEAVLIYQTFMRGNEKYGKPSSDRFLLREDELKDVFKDTLEVLSFSQGYVEDPKPAMIQGICCRCL
jgi:SAM-dependent methyltransferase